LKLPSDIEAYVLTAKRLNYQALVRNKTTMLITPNGSTEKSKMKKIMQIVRRN